MRLLIAAHGYPPTHAAGAEQRAERQARWLADQGHAVAVVAVEHVDAPERLDTVRQDGVDVSRIHVNLESHANDVEASYDHPTIASFVARRIREHAPDLVHIVSGHMIGRPTLAAARALHLPVVLTLTEFSFLCWRLNLIRPTGHVCSGPESVEKCTACWFEQKRRFKWSSRVAPRAVDWYWSLASRGTTFQTMAKRIRQRQRALREGLDWADAVIIPSRALMGVFQRYQYPADRFCLMRQGLVLPARLPPRPRRSHGVLRLGYLGQIKVHKGVDLLVRSVVELLEERRAVTLDIWGSDQEEPRYVGSLKRMSSRFPQIRWRGIFGAGGVWSALSEIDAVVVPSRWFENSPNVILEAFAMGVPVVATRLGGMAELVTDGVGGLLFELDSYPDLSRALRRLMDEQALLSNLRMTVPPVKTIDEEMREVVALYGRIMSGKSRADAPAAAAERPRLV